MLIDNAFNGEGVYLSIEVDGLYKKLTEKKVPVSIELRDAISFKIVTPGVIFRKTLY